MNLLVGIVALIIIISAYRGMKVGLIKTVFSIFSMIIALILTLWISPIISKSMQENETIVNYFAKNIEAAFPTEEVGNKVSDQINFIDHLPLPESIKDSINENNNPDTYVALAVNDFSTYISHAIASIIINAIAFVVTFVIFIIALRVLCMVLNIISKLPILNQINKLTGLFVGAVHGIIIIWLMFILLTAFAGSDIGQKAFVMINESPFLEYIYNNNLILHFITNISKVLF